MSELLPAILLSLRIAISATLLAAIVGIPLAFIMTRRSFLGRALMEALITLPLVLPPTVVGYLLILLCGTQGFIGQILYRWFAYKFLFTVESAILAAAVVALPLVYLPAKAAFLSVPREFEDIALTFGASLRQIFWHVSLPWARRGLVSGLLLAFARALGEFGATILVFGWRPGRQTLPILIYAHYEQGEFSAATGAVVVLLAMSLGLIFLYNRSPHLARE
jgi:molybdate transport system permease protein